MADVKLVSLLLLSILVAPIATQAAISCGQVQGSLAPCLNYLKGTQGNTPPADCCNGVESINSAAKTTPDRQAACKCLKTAAGSVPEIKPDLAASLPGKCSVNIPYQISLSTNCDSVK